MIIKKIKSTLGNNPVYITFDLDCLDPTIAPAVSNLEPGCNGFSVDEAISLIQSVWMPVIIIFILAIVGSMQVSDK